jgi:methionyl aminopeptidase
MREAGLITAAALKAVREAIAPGVSTLELDAIAEATIISMGARSNFKLVPGYNHTICASVNDEVVHGIPSKDRILQAGDTISVDCGANLSCPSHDAQTKFVPVPKVVTTNGLTLVDQLLVPKTAVLPELVETYQVTQFSL